ncbi:hypothetical protein [Streptomyces sp. NPDC001903]|uniref:hypothetical protein n=1 Tax=Streptomyces sp. NPDC001903 TaxID=3364622 RepID=UPI0036B0DB32
MADQPATIEEQSGVSDGVQQIPAAVTVTEVPAAADARDALLRAIGAEAQLVVEKSAGQAASALVELARAYALVASPAVPVVSTSRMKGDYNRYLQEAAPEGEVR